MSSPFLSEAQFSIMEKLENAVGAVRFNGQRRAAIKILENLGYITYTMEVIPDGLRGRHSFAYTVSLTDKGRIAFTIGGIAAARVARDKAAQS